MFNIHSLIPTFPLSLLAGGPLLCMASPNSILNFSLSWSANSSRRINTCPYIIENIRDVIRWWSGSGQVVRSDQSVGWINQLDNLKFVQWLVQPELQEMGQCQKINMGEKGVAWDDFRCKRVEYAVLHGVRVNDLYLSWVPYKLRVNMQKGGGGVSVRWMQINQLDDLEVNFWPSRLV